MFEQHFFNILQQYQNIKDMLFVTEKWKKVSQAILLTKAVFLKGVLISYWTCF